MPNRDDDGWGLYVFVQRLLVVAAVLGGVVGVGLLARWLWAGLHILPVH